MSQDNDYAAPRSPLPPPPPLPPPSSPPHLPQAPESPGLAGQVRAQQQTSPLRRIAVQPPLITTALAPPQGHTFAHTPASATSLSVPFSSYAPSPSTYAASPVPSSPMTMRTPSSVPYNPQQWGRQGPTGGVHVPHSVNQTPTATRGSDMTGMEGNSTFFCSSSSSIVAALSHSLHMCDRIVSVCSRKFGRDDNKY